MKLLVVAVLISLPFVAIVVYGLFLDHIIAFLGYPPPPAEFSSIRLDWSIDKIKRHISGSGARITKEEESVIHIEAEYHECRYELVCFRRVDVFSYDKLRFRSKSRKYLTYESTRSSDFVYALEA